MTDEIRIPEWCRERFGEFERSLDGGRDTAAHILRRRAFEALQKLGLPDTRSEEWKYTPFPPLAREGFALAGPRMKRKPAAAEIEARLSDPAAPRAVFINGLFAPELSRLSGLPRGVRCKSLAEILSPAGSGKASARTAEQHLARYAACGENALAALGTAFLRDGLLLTVERGVVWDRPLQLVFASSEEAQGAAVFPRLLALIEEGAAASVVETHLALPGAAPFVCAVSELLLGRGAGFEYQRLVDCGAGSCCSLVQGAAAASAVLRAGSFTFSGELVRNEIRLDLDGAGIDCGLLGLSVLDGQQHADNHVVLRHKQPGSQSRQNFKGVYAGSSRGVFSGTIIVDPEAQKTNAYQSSQSVLLSDSARSDSRPHLRILADDVKCSHGSTVGRLDEEGLFYLRSRGIPERSARQLLVRAFASQVVSQLREPALAGHVDRMLAEKLGRIAAL